MTAAPQVVYASTTRSKYVHVLRRSEPHPAMIRYLYECGGQAAVFPHGPKRAFMSTGFRGHMALKFRSVPPGAAFCPRCKAKLEAH